MSNTPSAKPLSINETPVIRPAEGKLGVLMPGMGAVTTTVIAGVEAVRRGLAAPVGSLTQLNTIRLGKRTDNNTPKIKDFVPLAKLDDIAFGCWDIFEDNAYEAAIHAGVIERTMLDQMREPLEAIKPMPAVFDSNFVKRIDGPNKKPKGSKMDHAEMLMDDIRSFKERTGATRLSMIWCGSTEVFHKAAAVHATLADFECGLQKDDPEISPSQIYAYAAIKSGANSLHGDLWEYVRNTVFNANDYFANQSGTPRPAYHQNQFGGTVGGPVYLPKLYNGKNKTFFFVDYQGTRINTPYSSTSSVPTAGMHGSNFTNFQDFFNLVGGTKTDALGRQFPLAT